MLFIYLATLFFLALFVKNVNQEIPDELTEEENIHYWIEIYGPIIAIAILNIFGIIVYHQVG